MLFPHQKYQSKVYQIFKEIGEQEYQSIVRFFEEYEQDIEHLTFEEHFELLFSYTNALFEIGAYSNYVSTCDIAIESSIQFNMKIFKGEDIYQKLLFRKAASFYHLMEYDKAEHILFELIKINPANSLAIQFLKKSKIARMPDLVSRTRAISIILFFIVAGIIALEQFYIIPFLLEKASAAMLVRNIVFGIGCLVLLGGDVLVRYRISRNIKAKVDEFKNRKKT